MSEQFGQRMDFQTLLLRMLTVALERLPDHTLTLDQATWDAMVEKYDGDGGLLMREVDDGIVVRLADHEDRAVFMDKVRKAGGALFEHGATTLGIIPTDEP